MADKERKYVANIEIRADNAVEAGQRVADSMNRVVESAQKAAQAIYDKTNNRMAKQYGNEAVQYKKNLDYEMRESRKAQQEEEKRVNAELKAYERAEKEKERIAQRAAEKEQKLQAKIRSEEEKRYESLSRNQRSSWWKETLKEKETAEKEYNRYIQSVRKQIEKEDKQEERQADAYNLHVYRQSLKEKKRLDQEALEQERALAREEEEILADRERRREAAMDNMVSTTSRALRVIAMELKRALTDAIQYVQEYDKALTSIAIVTGDATQKSVLGQRYETIARDMKVTSVEVATAAEELYRQGITDTDQVEQRLKTITEFAKISGLTFSDSVDVMTAAINNFTGKGEDAADTARRIADVWSYLGDATATGSDEIGLAMQKVAASGQTAGLTLEKLSSYIAVIEAKTRLAPESVGTTLNSIMSRYMKVTSAGFNKSVTTDEGDVLNLNDISKALQTVGINIYNVETGFAQFGDVLDELSGKWGSLTDKEKAYIATQIAGTRGLNMFLALMNDYGSSLELTAQALDSAGTATRKYDIWQQGLEATSNELSAIIKDIYSDIVDSDAVKQFYEMLISIASGFDKIIKATDGWTVKISLLGAGLFSLIRILNTVKTSISDIGSFSAVFKTLTGALTGTTVAAKGLSLALSTVGIGLAIGAVATLVGYLFSLGESAEEAAERWNGINDSYAKSNASLLSYIDISKKLYDSMNNNTMSAAEYHDIREQIIAQNPNLSAVLASEIDDVDDLREAYERLNDAVAAEISSELRRQHVTAYSNVNEASKKLTNVQRVLYRGATNYKDLTRARQEIVNSSASDRQAVIEKWLGSNEMSLGDADDVLIELEAEKAIAIQAYEKYNSEESANRAKRLEESISAVQAFIDARETELKNELDQYVETIIRASFNPDSYTDISEYLPTLTSNLLSQEWGERPSYEIYDAAADYIAMMADVLAGPLKTDLIDKIDSIFPDIGFGDKIVEGLLRISPEEASEYVDKMYNDLQRAIETKDYMSLYESIAEMFNVKYYADTGDNTSTSSVASSGSVSSTDAESEFKSAYERLQKIQTLYDSIQEMQTTGALEAKSKKALADAYPELESSMGTYNELLDATVLLLNSENEAYGPLLNQYGLAVKLNTGVADSLLKVVTSGSKTSEIMKKLHKGYQLTEDDLKEIVKTYPELIDDLYEYTNGSKSAMEFTNALTKAQTDANGAELMKNAKEQLDAIEKYGKATAEYASAMEQLGNLFTLGFGDINGADFAAKYLDDIRAAANGSEAALRRLQEAAYIHITGSSDVDFSSAENGLINVSKMSAATLELLRQLGLFDIETVKLPQTYYTYDYKTVQKPTGIKQGTSDFSMWEAGNIATTVTATPHTVYSTQTMLKPKSMSSIKIPTPSTSKSSSGGGGGGGGGGSSSSSSASSAVQKKLAELKKMTEIIDLRIKIAQAWQGFYEQTGELNKTIPYMEHQIELYNELITVYQQNRDEIEPMVSTYEENVKSIKAQIASLEELRDKYAEGSSNYKKYQTDIDDLNEKLTEAESDYDALVNAVDEYTLSEIEAKKSIVELNDAIDEQRYKIRGLTGDMKNQISDYLDAIKSRQKDILSATVSMQNEIMDILRENERKRLELDNEILENKKKTLEDELDAIRKNYDEARALADKQAQEDELAEKQRQLAILSLDPTKEKERAALEKEIYDLQNKMAWDAAEDQIDIQEQSIQAQIDEYDKLIQANEDMIDKLSEYSEEIVNQMYEIMNKSGDELLNWLKDNSGEYAEATKEAQQIMVDDWQETIDAINDLLRTNWDEVDKLMAEGLDSVIAKLKETTDYLSANTEDQINQVEDLTKAWEKMLLARKELTDAEYNGNKLSIMDRPTTSGSQGGVDTPTNPTDPTESVATGVTASVLAAYNMRESPDVNSKRVTTLQAGAQAEVTGYKGDWYKVSSGGSEGWMYKDAFGPIDLSKLKKYKNGGIINTTGLLWADGTPGVPEGILSGEQFKLFQNFVSGLERLAAPDYSGRNNALSGINVEEGGIVINVESLDGTSDYEGVADQLLDALYTKFMVRR